MTHKTHSIIFGLIFLVIAVLHFLRIVNKWNAMIGGLFIPIWASWILLLVAGFLAYQGLKEAK